MSTDAESSGSKQIFHHSQFADLDELVHLKHQASSSLAVIIPSLNEERSIAEVVSVLRQTLQLRHPLIDELLVVDSGSTDATCERAGEAGATVIEAAGQFPDLPAARGKGENLWVGLASTKSDLVCFVDADISNIHPRFVYGLVGPLLERPDLSLIKAFYERPMASGSAVLPDQGGRVSEILVRPIFSLFYPELARLNQPLSGEYAARRELLESLPFPTGYGIEAALLIDTLRLGGADLIGQTDLDVRFHRNRSLADLSAMSLEILRTILPRLERDGHCHGLPELAGQLIRPGQKGGPGGPGRSLERPPLKDFPAAT